MKERTDSTFPVMSDDALTANVVVFASEMLRRATYALVHTGSIDLSEIQVPLPFSRAEGVDYTRIVELWNEYRAVHPLQVPPRPCPACCSSNSTFEFYSYDGYPFHSCTHCGTWFVPLRVDDRVIGEFFDAVPEARQRSDKMMAERNQRTQESDRERFDRYFRMLEPHISTLSGTVRYLDLGSGVGHSVELASERGWRALGVEVNEVAVATARANGRNVVRPGEIGAGRQFDIISMFETLEHITDPNDVMGGLAESLAPGGVVMMTMPHRASFELSLLKGRSFHVFGGFENVGHINLFDANGLEALLQRHGLTTLFIDGEFSSDLTQILSFVSERRSMGAEPPTGDHLTLKLPQMGRDLVNALGPAFAAFERALRRSPILIAIACRPSDVPALAGLKAALDANWRVALDEMLNAGERTMQAHQSSLRDQLAELQGEVARRDALLQKLQDSANNYVSRRDGMLQELQESANDIQHQLHQTHLKLVESQERYARTLEGRVRKLARRLLLGRSD